MNNLRELAFRMRGFTPVPFIVVSLWWAHLNLYFFITGAIVSILGEMLRFQSIKYVGGATRTRKVGAEALVTTGPYGIMRNPLYFANMMIYIGYAIGSASLSPFLPLIALLFFSTQYYLIITLEENTLKDIFGQSYSEYCQNVPRVFPKFQISDKISCPNFCIREAFRQERSTLMGIFLSWSLLISRIYFV